MPLRVERHDRVLVLTLDDPAKRNALGLEMVDQIVEAVTAANTDESVRALVLTGAPPAFCSGADRSNLDELHTNRGGDPGSVRNIYEGFLSVRDSPLPTVAAVNGYAVGAGFNLAMCCDAILAGESARFAPGFGKIGIHPGGGHTWMLERAVGPHNAAAIALFGEILEGPRAAELGLAWRCVADGALLGEAIALATRVSDLSRELAIAIKASLREMPWQPNFQAAVTTELDRQKRSFGA
jgi:enoyl-CoA hydratase